MTRETKIGLLVGLAFIIVIGILLSDHLTSSTEPPQAALAGAGNNVRSAVTVPGQAAPQPAAQPTPVVTSPNQPVPTRDELTPQPNPVSIVQIGPAAGSGTGDKPHATNETAQTQQAEPENPAAVATNDAPTITKAPATPASASASSKNTPLDNLAHQHGEELVLLDNNGRAIRGRSQTTPRGAMAEYKAEPGDSLSKMASKLMGSNSKAN